MSPVVVVMRSSAVLGTFAGLGWWSAVGGEGHRAVKTLVHVILLWLSIGAFVGVAVYFGFRRTRPRLARAALGVQLIGTPLVIGLMMLSP